VVFVGTLPEDMPVELERRLLVEKLELPGRGVLRAKVKAELGDAVNGELEKLVEAAVGMDLWQVETELAMQRVMGGVSVAGLRDAKEKLVEQAGICKIVRPAFGIDGLGGMRVFKAWLQRRLRALNSELAKTWAGVGLPRFKGIALIGPPGTGKTAFAEALASAMNKVMMLVTADMVYDQYVGGSEQAMARIIEFAEAMGNGLLVFDEVEKLLAGASGDGGNDGGATRKVAGLLLTYMASKTKETPVCATMNGVVGIPPEMLRKGRFDELWFVDLPGIEARTEIVGIHFARRGLSMNSVAVKEVVAVTGGFSGAELEAALEESMFLACEAGLDYVSTEHYLAAVEETVPLSVTMAAEQKALADFAKGRFRFADDEAVSGATVAAARGGRAAGVRMVDFSALDIGGEGDN
jgi:hypothetical protein